MKNKTIITQSNVLNDIIINGYFLNTCNSHHEIYKKHNNASIKKKSTSETSIILISLTAVPPAIENHDYFSLGFCHRWKQFFLCIVFKEQLFLNFKYILELKISIFHKKKKVALFKDLLFYG